MTPTFASMARMAMAAPRDTDTPSDAPADASNSIDESLGDRLREQRTSRGLSQEQLAKKLQIRPDDINAYESGTRRISADRLLRIASVLNVRPESFFRFGDGRRGEAAADGHRRSGQSIYPTSLDQGLRLQRAFVSIGDASLRESIVGLVVELARSENSEQQSAE
jgi:transcriptional regulator with XRE-family HTH domain